MRPAVLVEGDGIIVRWNDACRMLETLLFIDRRIGDAIDDGVGCAAVPYSGQGAWCSFR